MKTGIPALLFCCIALPAAGLQSNGTYGELLEYRLQNDNEYTYLQIEAQTAENELLKVKTDSAIDVSLNTGDIVLSFGQGAGGTGISMNPDLKIRFPSLNNTGISFSAPWAASQAGTEAGAGIAVSTDLYSQNRRKHRLELAKAEFEAEKARRKYRAGRQIIEKKLLQDIQALYKEYTALLDKAMEEAQARIKYNQIKVQGYSEDSAKLRSSQLSLLSAEREHRQAAFSFSVTYRRFLESCGITDERDGSAEFMQTLSASVPERNLLTLDGLSADTYIQVADAEETYRLRTEERRIAASPLALSARTGYSFSRKDDSTPQHIQGGLTAEFPGGTASALVTVPVVGSDATTLKFGLTFKPFAAKNRRIDRETGSLQDTAERLKVSDLKKRFETDFSTMQLAREQLIWQRQISAEELSVYRQNAADHELWFKKGFASESERDQAELEYRKAAVRAVNANLSILLFNIETALQFNTDGGADSGQK